jgi:hypothetical protein
MCLVASRRPELVRAASGLLASFSSFRLTGLATDQFPEQIKYFRSVDPIERVVPGSVVEEVRRK